MRYLFALACVAALGSYGCGDSSTGPSGGSGTLNMRITDSPFSDAKAVIVKIKELSVHRDDAPWETVAFPAPATTWACDLKKLEGPIDVLGGSVVPAGHYTQIRLVVDTATIYWENVSGAATPCAADIPAPAGTFSALEIPSGEVKLNRGFDLAADGTTTVTLDFDGDKSIQIHETGNGRFIMRPVITVKSVGEEQ
jgi:uncharacterized protein DUF4382